jgi:hypothetical protein
VWLQTVWCNSGKVTRLLLSRIAGAPFQFQKCAQALVRFHDVTSAIAMSVNDPTPAVSGNGAAILPCPTGSAELVSDQLRARSTEDFAQGKATPGVRHRGRTPVGTRHTPLWGIAGFALRWCPRPFPDPPRRVSIPPPGPSGTRSVLTARLPSGPRAGEATGEGGAPGKTLRRGVGSCPSFSRARARA